MNYEMRLRAIWTDIMELDAASFSITNRLIDNGMNSIVFIKMIIAIEEEFGFEFEDEYLNINLFITIEDIVEYIKKRISM